MGGVLGAALRQAIGIFNGGIGLTVFVAARAYRVCEAVVANEPVAYRANCELLFVVVV